MNILYTFVEIVHYIVCISLILIVLFQAGKSGGMAGIFGGGSSDQIFNAPSGMAFIKKVTVVMACVFVVTSITLTKLSTDNSFKSVIGSSPVAAAPSQPQ
ncbi:preprotein translocase subunit SecG [Endomicrobium proavitum]|uniref:Protein-export membrane protein SecG n=1 Tax=Endomicrobium proavitum TaxID=1408281 RepID=A0A0G3WFU8_9BACT|nr:preprotein translocase subunit SecG [Endomicrobium proavitum]AKL97486.1 Protein translocase subunit SecG (modular protein) [Endomicrobium proavitum]